MYLVLCLIIIDCLCPRRLFVKPKTPVLGDYSTGDKPRKQVNMTAYTQNRVRVGNGAINILKLTIVARKNTDLKLGTNCRK